MDEVEYLDNGTVVVRNSKSSRCAFTSPKASPRDPDPESPRYQWDETYAGIFHVEHKTYDVTLSDSRITFNIIKGQSTATKKKKKKEQCTDVLSKGFISYRDIYAVDVKRNKRSTSKASEGICIGIYLYTYERKDFNRLKDKVLLLEHPSEELCAKWHQRLEMILSSFSNRPSKIRVYIQPHAGKKNGRALLKQCESLFELARVTVTIKEIYLPNSLEDDVKRLVYSDYDGIAIVGGDGTVHKVINALMNKIQQEENIDVRLGGNSPTKLSIPIAVIPVGTTNHIAQSVQGTDDIITATFHIIFGNTVLVDLCSIYHRDKFLRWAFNSQYGFCGNILEFSEKFNILGQKRIDAAFLKALTKSKLRPYECEVQYIPSPNSCQNNALDGIACRTGCSVCLHASPGSRRSSVYTDSLQEYDPLAISGTSSTIIDLSKETPWRTTKGIYLNVALFTIPAVCEFAPQGLSKYSHLADGCMDLVLVRDVDRKDFVRYLRRHGTSKNQFEFPFVEVYRVKEVKFRSRLHTTWKHDDHEFSEIDYEMRRSQNRGLQAISEHELDIIDDLDLHDDNDDLEDLSDPDDQCDGMDQTLRGGSASSKTNSENLSLKSSSLSIKSNNNEQEKRQASSAPVRKSLQSEQMKELRFQKKRKKEEKAKQKEEVKSKSVWNIDNEIVREIDLDFKVHAQIIQLFGLGLSPDTPPEEVKFGCLPGF